MFVPKSLLPLKSNISIKKRRNVEARRSIKIFICKILNTFLFAHDNMFDNTFVWNYFIEFFFKHDISSIDRALKIVAITSYVIRAKIKADIEFNQISLIQRKKNFHSSV